MSELYLRDMNLPQQLEIISNSSNCRVLGDSYRVYNKYLVLLAKYVKKFKSFLENKTKFAEENIIVWEIYGECPEQVRG